VIPLCAELGSSDGSGEPDTRVLHELRVGLDRFTHEALQQEAALLDVSIEEFVRFAVLYYLADHDSGRIARRLPLLSTPEQPHPLDELLGD
jgi:hypothetical protein